MAPLPENATARLFVDYTDGLNNHTLMFRYPVGVGATEVMEVVDDYLSSLSPILHLLTITAARISSAGSEFSFPTAWTGLGTYGSGTIVGWKAPAELSFVGRSADGRRARWFLFGYKDTIPNDFRLSTGDNTAVLAAYNDLVDAALAGTICTIGGIPPVIYPYANVNFNSYYETKQRG